jgi:hypothetical protein
MSRDQKFLDLYRSPGTVRQRDVGAWDGPVTWLGWKQEIKTQFYTANLMESSHLKSCRGMSLWRPCAMASLESAVLNLRTPLPEHWRHRYWTSATATPHEQQPTGVGRRWESRNGKSRRHCPIGYYSANAPIGSMLDSAVSYPIHQLPRASTSARLQITVRQSPINTCRRSCRTIKATEMTTYI